MGKLGFETLGGDGASLLLLHGLGADRLSWTGIAPALTDSFSVNAVELPGHGRAAELDPGDSLDALLGAFESLLESLEGPLHLVGHSLGGGIALLLSERYEQRIASLSLLAPAGLGAGVQPAFLSTLPALDDASSANRLLQSLVVNPRLVPSALGEMLVKHLDAPGVRARVATMAARVPAVEAAVGELAQRWGERPRPPVLVLFGEQDAINPPPVGNPLGTVGVRYERLANCGHLPHVESRAEVTRLLRAFLVE